MKKTNLPITKQIHSHLDLYNLIIGEVVEIKNGSAFIKEDDGDIYWVSKQIMSCNPNVKKGYRVDIECVSDSVGHMVYVNSEDGEERYCSFFER
jgi:hypothetical protein